MLLDFFEKNSHNECVEILKKKHTKIEHSFAVSRPHGISSNHNLKLYDIALSLNVFSFILDIWHNRMCQSTLIYAEVRNWNKMETKLWNREKCGKHDPIGKMDRKNGFLLTICFL